ncbi:MAG: preprotein translocase subunit YajC [Burkholderiaceae bacterium]
MFLISNAYAQAAPAAAPGAESSFMSIGFMVLIFVVFYFLLIRPQVKRQKEHKAMIDALKKGDEVLTAGGIVGKIVEIHEQYVTVQVAAVNGQPVQLSMQRTAVQTILPKDTFKPA